MNKPLNVHSTAPTQRHPHSWAAAALCAVALALSGCASTPTSPEETVRQLATQRWQAILANQHERAYEFTNPAYRKLRTREQFVQTSQATSVKWTSAEVVRVECQALKCQVAIKTTSQLKMPTFFKGPLVSGLDETWVFEDRRWWKLEKL